MRNVRVWVLVLAVLAVSAGCGSGDDGGQRVHGVVTASTSTDECLLFLTTGGEQITGARVTVQGEAGTATGTLRFDSFAGPASDATSYGVCAWTFDFRAPASPTYSVQIADRASQAAVSGDELRAGKFAVRLGSAEVTEA